MTPSKQPTLATSWTPTRYSAAFRPSRPTSASPGRCSPSLSRSPESEPCEPFPSEPDETPPSPQPKRAKARSGASANHESSWTAIVLEAMLACSIVSSLSCGTAHKLDYSTSTSTTTGGASVWVQPLRSTTARTE